MIPPDNNREEAHLASLLAAAAKDVIPPDRAFLEALRDRSTQEFLNAPALQVIHPPRRRSMIAASVRWIAAAAAAILLAFIGLHIWNSAERMRLGDVFEQAARASSLQFQLTSAGRTSEIWVEHPNNLRWDLANGTYRIARGDKQWVIDEAQNRAIPQASEFFRAQGGIDLLRLFEGISTDDRGAIEAQLPREHAAKDGQDFLVYRCDIHIGNEQASLEALVSSSTRALQSLELRKPNRPNDAVTKLTLVAQNQPVAKEKFVVSDTLTEDGRIGKVVDSQGIALLRPVMHARWTPVRNQLMVKPGDWLRTDLRGANAVAVQLVPHTRVILGPGTQVEMIKPTQLRLDHGELEVKASAKTEIEVIGPMQQKIVVKDTQRIRLHNEKLALVKDEPLWLKGFKGATNNESIGALIATVDGRNLPLTVGYHKVSVDIRDQIARTVIEESFVNHTDGLLEGVFHFPLPQDASISGFGMWIGDNLVEADVVEKQRAREIYETILREKRDPGLLEWTGGNIFKARVYPIFAHSEKRIKITYTQVLPLQGGQYRYSYALQSEMLKQHPLRELNIDVRINSAVKLKGVHCSTHATRDDKTAHSAHVEFGAQEYTPARDFEVVVETDAPESPIVVIPHRRGDDGYFMLQIMPAGADATADRDLLPDGQPVRLLVLVDTSASIDASQRANQNAFLAALLSGLTPKDEFNLAGCDVDCDWAFPKAMPADARNASTALQFAAGRVSLGWTDLDKAFASACAQLHGPTHVIYLGDGVVTSSDADPVEFGKRLRRLYADKGKDAVFHAVALGSSFEPGTLKTIASLGGGSLRRISGERGPAAAAFELLREIARPGLRDLKVDFKGVRTSRVYPEMLPNTPGGTQQVIVGRYLPEGRDQAGQVIVTGVRGQQPVQWQAPITLKDAEQGNSFIPRLWARMHLDHLLEQGSTPSIKDEIIALSEEYQIITPYTSLLVLETDADRERFKVKRRFQMRDGEKFFAEGRDNAQFELLQQQMVRAGNWRLGLRRSVLEQLTTLGRDVRMFQSAQPSPYGYSGRLGGYGGGGPMAADAPMGGPVSESMPVYFGATLGDVTRRRLFDEYSYERSEAEGKLAEDFAGKDRKAGGAGGGVAEPESRMVEEALRDKESLEDLMQEIDGDEKREALAAGSSPRGLMRGGRAALGNKPLGSMGFDYDEVGLDVGRLTAWGPALASKGIFDGDGSESAAGLSLISRRQYAVYQQSLLAAFPSVPSPSTRKTSKAFWKNDAHELAQSLLRTSQLGKLVGGVCIERTIESFDARWSALTQRSTQYELFSAERWLQRHQNNGDQTLVHWCDEKDRGVWSAAFLLGTVRAVTANDTQAPLGLADFSLMSLEETYREYVPSIAKIDQHRVHLTLANPQQKQQTIQIEIDTARHVIVSIENRMKNKRTSLTRFDDFVELADCWWARKTETLDDKDRRTSLTTQTLAKLEPGIFTKEWQKALSGRDAVLFLRQPIAKVEAAKIAAASGKATFEDQVSLMIYFAASQQWTRVADHLQAAEALAKNKPGFRWLRAAVLNNSRQFEELKNLFTAEAKTLSQRPAGNHEAAFLANYLIGRAQQSPVYNEMLDLLNQLKPIFEVQPPYRQAMKHWNETRVVYLTHTGQMEDSLRLRKQIATDYPHDTNSQYYYAQELVNAGEYPAAYAWLTGALAREKEWYPHERDSLHGLYAQFLETQGRLDELATYAREWIKDNPESHNACAQYLSALMRSGQEKQAEQVMAEWIREGQVVGERPPVAAIRLSAAVALALGSGHNLYTNRIEPRWLKPLEDLARFAMRQPTQMDTANSIISHHQFQHSDNGRAIRKSIAEIVDKDIAALSFVELTHYVPWLLTNDPALSVAQWKQIADGLNQRWTRTTDADEKHRIGQVLLQVLSGHAKTGEQLAFLHMQMREGPARYRTEYVRGLYNALIAQSWSAEYEDEALSLLSKLSDAENPDERLAVQVKELHQLSDRMIITRMEARMAKVEHQEKLTRVELQKLKAENLKQARQAFANRLGEETKRHQKSLAQWIELERLYFDALAPRDLKQLAARCWDLLANAPKPANPNYQPLATLFEERVIATLTNLAARKNADPALIEKLNHMLGERAAGGGDEDLWRRRQYRLLVALDRPKDLEQSLRRWIESDGPSQRWRIPLGYLMAEQGRVAEAIKLFEAVEKSDELGPTAYRALAGWYMAVNDRAKHERSEVAAWRTTEEWQLSRALSAKLNPWMRRDGHMPSELDQQTLHMFAALFAKSAAPQNYLWQLQQFYQATHDFRLLGVLADAVVGHSAGRVYPFIVSLQSVLSEVRDEATVDSIVEQLARLRRTAKSEVDRRALDLFELQVRRRAAEIKNQPGPHVAAALAAMQRAYKRGWAPGEPRLMADFLAGLGAISRAELSKEQLDELAGLHRAAEKNSFDRLHIAHQWANALNGYGRTNEAVEQLQAALDEYQDASKGVLPVAANPALSSLIAMLESQNHFDRAERILLAHRKHPFPQQQFFWLTNRLYILYANALRQGGNTSLGSGLTLYQAAERVLRDDLATTDTNHRSSLVQQLCTIYRIGNEKNWQKARDDLRVFAFEHFPKLLKRHTADGLNLVDVVARTVHDMLSPADAVLVLVNYMENEPSWMRYTYQDGWNRFSYTIGQWREEAKTLGEADARLLRIVDAELRRDLESGQHRNRVMYHRHYNHFWADKADVFAKTAEEVLDHRKHSGASVRYIAEYFYWGLNLPARAIEVLAAAHSKKQLDESGQQVLVRFLHEQNRFADSIDLLRAMIEARPTNLDYRVQLIRAYFRTGRANDMHALLKATDTLFHKENRWQEGVIASLASISLECQQYEPSVAYYKELIPLHERSHANRGIGNGTLSHYYSALAQAYAGLQRTPEAVEAASGAVVSWGPSHRNRASALAALKQVLQSSANLDRYVAHLDEQCAKEGRENPIVRKALGQVYMDRGDYARAQVQLLAAIEVQPNDAETGKALLACCDKRNDAAGAIQQTLKLLQLSRRDIHLYQELGERFARQNQPHDAERAFTSIVEVLPNESEGHALLAEIREKQNRWSDAIHHWQLVAKIRALEPTGLLKLAAAQIHEQSWDNARKTLERLTSRSWPPHFGDVPSQVRQLETQVPKN